MLYDGRQYESDPIRDHILEAANLIEKNGWCRHHSHRKTLFGNTQYCIMGALNAIGNDTYKVAVRISQHLNKKYSETHGMHFPISYWNDEIAQSKKQVVEDMREAAYHKETINVV